MRHIGKTLTFRGATYHTRDNKTATGMSKTHAPQRWKSGLHIADEHERAVLSLVVKGTTDILGRGMWFITKRAPCPCCGAPSQRRVQLNDAGRRRLRILKRKREAEFEVKHGCWRERE